MSKNFFYFSGIRKKLIIYFIILTLIIASVSFFSYSNTKATLARLKLIITDYVYLNNLNNDVSSLTIELEEYLTIKSSNALLNYYTIYNRLKEKSEAISREIVYDCEYIMMKDIAYMIEEFLVEADNAIQAKRGRQEEVYIAHFTRANEIADYIKHYINRLLNNKLQRVSVNYEELNNNTIYINYINLVLIFISIIISISLAILFTYRLTKPIIKLAHSAERVSQGDFDIEPVEIEATDEINVLAIAFNKMINNIRKYIYEIKKQAQIEKKLKEQELLNFKIKSLLKDMELKSLQSQINPHFLFNTLNTASQLAMIEGAEKSSEFIENIAQLLRYNLRKLDKPVTLQEEINNVKNYMNILKTRFGNRIEFYSQIDERAVDVKIPCTIIQPIVENAYIHGLEDLERKGEIHLNINIVQDKILIEITDNGKGMDEDKIKSIIFSENSIDLAERHVNGIGINNVIDRLRIFYNISDIKDVIDIKSQIGHGTTIIIKIPFNKEVMANDKAINC
ncbi:sensor histidine kinase [Paramaledivibacter caminithermalis]|jgi:sensor histidine kinase YesM|uniref:Histidine kinase-, DNA gyrase B-, and HSP90-like ATPase n=1 Tax=Paramaledivibacter caminithermalis (strain DSM 15212 / CIP 107654 / DViRD3) TaxID=1121301 RepID=A0A1M6RWH5_PARC5|nr:histidine kinase [Paramaledivibacter caminithermalis]SHK36800.1 Histidine kinase-, DNA gyrase B-, and HSP90-like ATPase [Paramaledivibacter caminithermalis DSM 15212]